MNLVQVAEAKILRGDIIETLYTYYGTDCCTEKCLTGKRICGR